MYYKNISWKEEVNKKKADMQLQKERLIESTLKFKPTTNESSEKRSERKSLISRFLRILQPEYAVAQG